MNFNIFDVLNKCLHLLYKDGHTTASGGNISSKDEKGNIWISPSQIDKGFLKADDFVCLHSINGWVGSNKPSMEYPFHLAIYKSYSEVKVICHLHPPVLVALSILSSEDKIFKEVLKKFNLGYATYAIPGSAKLGDNICKAFQSKPKAVLMQNHGIISIGNDSCEASGIIKKLNKQIYIYFNLGNQFIKKPMYDLEYDDSPEFYKQRAKYFLSLQDDKIEIYNIPSMVETNFNHFAIIKLNTLSGLRKLDVNFRFSVIPESYLLLREPIIIEDKYKFDKLNVYINKLNSNSPILIFNDDTIILAGTSLFNLYDRMEVLDFTLKVIYYAQKMGSVNYLSASEIQELKDKFLVKG
jgi:ribulose-5-phosphate 4-epimerase/fuculose-1-phosphate aldolase